MGRFVALDYPGLDRLVEESCASIGREIDELRVPHLVGVVLGGGYGRGEGGVREEGTGNGKRETGNGKRETGNGERLSNDLDFFVVADESIPEAEAIATIGAALKPVSEKWTKRLGVDVDFAVKTRWRLKHDEERIMVQELLRGYFDVAGEKGAAMFDGIESRPAEALPWMEAARLLMNRGMGLLFAGECGERGTGNGEREFAARNINKCILGAGDARLVARHAYAWRAVDRAKALGDPMYSAALDWKFKPGEEPVCGWEAARKTWLEAFCEVFEKAGASSGAKHSRNVRNIARWLVRRRSLGDLRTIGLDPVVRILETVSRHVRERTSPGKALLRDWEIFN